jgi:hypothetical protein
VVEVDDDWPVYGNATIIVNETSLDSPDVSEITGVHPDYLRLLGCIIIIITSSFFMTLGLGCPPWVVGKHRCYPEYLRILG